MTLRWRPSSVCPPGRWYDQVSRSEFREYSPLEGLNEQRGKFARTQSYLVAILLVQESKGSIPKQFHNFFAFIFKFCSLESITWRQCKNMLLIQGNVAKMLPVKSEGACSLTLVPGPAHLISQDNSGKFTTTWPAIVPGLFQDSFSKDL